MLFALMLVEMTRGGESEVVQSVCAAADGAPIHRTLPGSIYRAGLDGLSRKWSIVVQIADPSRKLGTGSQAC